MVTNDEASLHGHNSMIGGRLCLDFTNTASNREGAAPTEHLASYADLVDWCAQADLFGETEAARLLAEAQLAPERATQAFQRAIRVREAIYGLCRAVARESPAEPDALEVLNGVLADGTAGRRLRPGREGYCWAWSDEANGLDWMVWPIAYSAAELLTSSDIGRLKQCTGPTCDWLFIDESRNRSRRWCDMRDCGNRAKARRHYARKRGSAEPETRLPQGS
jgi:predicted RNA-binding Zn ribbon-like protein